MCSLGIEPTTFCAADAMLYHWATQEHALYSIYMRYWDLNNWGESKYLKQFIYNLLEKNEETIQPDYQ